MFKTIRLFHQLVKFSMLVLCCPILHAVSSVFSAACSRSAAPACCLT